MRCFESLEKSLTSVRGAVVHGVEAEEFNDESRHCQETIILRDIRLEN